MLTIEFRVRELLALPIPVQLGLAALLGGVVADVLADVLAHLSMQAAEHPHGFSLAEVWAHVVGVVGMVVILLGVVIGGARQSHPDRPVGDSTKGGA